MYSATLTRLYLTGLLALPFSPLAASGEIGPQAAGEQPIRAGDEADEMPWVTSPRQVVRKLGDGELSCAQIYEETRLLEKSSEKQQAAALQAQRIMSDTQGEMLKEANGLQGGGMGSAIGGGLLGLIPGGSQIHGYAMQAAASARRAKMQEATSKMMQAQMQLMNLEQAMEQSKARSDHLADLFLRKDCKLSQARAAASADR